MTDFRQRKHAQSNKALGQPPSGGHGSPKPRFGAAVSAPGISEASEVSEASEETEVAEPFSAGISEASAADWPAPGPTPNPVSGAAPDRASRRAFGPVSGVVSAPSAAGDQAVPRTRTATRSLQASYSQVAPDKQPEPSQKLSSGNQDAANNQRFAGAQSISDKHALPDIHVKSDIHVKPWLSGALIGSGVPPPGAPADLEADLDARLDVCLEACLEADSSADLAPLGQHQSSPGGTGEQGKKAPVGGKTLSGSDSNAAAASRRLLAACSADVPTKQPQQCARCVRFHQRQFPCIFL
jgi:hypothetical protein